MTLLATEIHNHDDPDNAAIVFAADRRITNSGTYYDTRKKIFKLPWLKAGIGYFGLAVVEAPHAVVSMQQWLDAFIRKNTDYSTLAEFSNRLASALNTGVPKTRHRTDRSGFHIAGFNAESRPEFWFVRNIDNAGGLTLGAYQTHEQFQGRDAPTLPSGKVMIYRNGDIRAHEAAWKTIDESFGRLLLEPDFRKLRNAEDYKEWVRFKMKLIAYFYKKYHPEPVIATPIDAILITNKGIIDP